MENTKQESTKEEPKDVFVLRKVRAPARYLPDGIRQKTFEPNIRQGVSRKKKM